METYEEYKGLEIFTLEDGRVYYEGRDAATESFWEGYLRDGETVESFKARIDALGIFDL